MSIIYMRTFLKAAQHSCVICNNISYGSQPLISNIITSSPTFSMMLKTNIPLTKITAVQNETALSYHRLRGLYCLAVVSEAIV